MFDKIWDPQTVHAPYQHLVPDMRLMDDSIPFAKGGELIMDIPVDARGTGDVYIDDLIQATVVIEGMDNAIQCKCATLLAIDTCACPKHANKPIPREDMEARNKLQTEARLEGLGKATEFDHVGLAPEFFVLGVDKKVAHFHDDASVSVEDGVENFARESPTRGLMCHEWAADDVVVHMDAC